MPRTGSIPPHGSGRALAAGIVALAAGTLVVGSGCGGPEYDNIRSLTPEVAVFPDAVDFGEVVVTRNLVQTVTVQNAGKGDMDVQLAIVGGDGAFELTETTGTVEPDGAWSVPISFAPETFVTYDAVLEVTSNDPDEEDKLLSIPLTGIGVDAPMPDIELSPLTLDFGTVTVGTASTPQILDLKNVGNAPLTMGVLEQTGSGAFQLLSDPSQSVIGGDSTVPVVIGYTPTTDLGDSGWLLFPSDDPDEPAIEVLLLGNGGGDFDYPEAVIDCPGTSAPPTYVNLDGTGSFDPGGGALEYLWTLPNKPSGSQGGLTSLVTDVTELYTDIAGQYEVQLVVKNDQGTVSAPDRCYIDAIPADQVHVELTWDLTNVDLDLHLLEDGYELYEEPGDCTWCNKNPQWGAAGSDDDPRLDLDDRSDGPENINILEPADGTYHVKVHYFESNGNGAATATVTVYTFGVEVWSGSKVMKRNEVWDVGQVNWPDGTFGTSNAALYDAPIRTCY